MDPNESTAIIQQNGNKPQDWLDYIKNAKREAAHYKTLLSLYNRAANLISPDEHGKNPAYAKLLVEFAKLQGMSSVDDARDTFRVARCNVKRFAIIYVAWAQLELTQGNRGKCKSLLRKGKLNRAEPADILQMAIANCDQGEERLLDEETEELAFTGVERVPSTFIHQSASTVNSDNDTTVENNPADSGIVSFKLPSILEGYRNNRQHRSSSSSSSGEETVTAPFHHICWPVARSASMLTHKPVIKATPDCKSAGSNSLSNSMNLTVRKPKARRGLGSCTVFLGLPTRGNSSLHDVKERTFEGEDGVEHMEALEPTIDMRSGHQNAEDHLHTQKPESTDPIIPPKPAVNDTTCSPCYQSKEYSVEQQSNGITRCSPCYQEKSKEYSMEQQSNGITTCSPCYQSKEYSVEQQSNGVATSSVSAGRVHCPTGNTPNVSFPTGYPSGNVSSGTINPGYYQGRVIPPAHPPVVPFVHHGMMLPPQAVSSDTIVVNSIVYQKLEKIGRGGSSKVFRAFDGNRVCAVKCVSLEDADEMTIQSYINEITLLKRLQGSDHIIKLFNWERNKDQNSIVLVLECGSIDLAAFLRKNRSTLTQTDLSSYWKQMLQAVNVIHEEGIIHSDLKPANFLFVEGRLKLIDFGIANAIQGDQTSIQRDTQVGTLNFMSPEAFHDISGSHQMDPSTGRRRACMKIGRASDVWSLGCMLYNMVYGQTPFQHITNQAMKLQCIVDPNYTIEFPSIENSRLLDVMKGCLIRNPRERYTIPQLLQHPFLASGVNSAAPDPEQLFKCLVEFAQADVNSPRSIRVVSKRICEQLRSGNKIDLSSVLSKPNPACTMATGQH